MGSPREKTMVPSTDEVAGAPSWEVRMLLERAAELERLQRFEEALVLYHRGRKRAPLVAAFAEGIGRVEQAVDSAIGAGAAELFADIPGLLPGMIEEQATARCRSMRAARAAHDRLKEAVRNMTFSEKATSRAVAEDDADDDDLDVVGGGGTEVACSRQRRELQQQQPPVAVREDGVVAIPQPGN